MSSIIKDITNIPSNTAKSNLRKSNSLSQIKPERTLSNQKSLQVPVYNCNEVIQELESDSSSYYESDSDENFNNEKLPTSPNIKYSPSNSTATVFNVQESSPRVSPLLIPNHIEQQINTQLDSLSITIRKGRAFNQMELVNIANMIRTDPQRTKFVKLSFRNCGRMDDTDVANIGAAVGSQLRNVEYLSLNFHVMKSFNTYGIMQLIRAISGPGNTLKSLRIRIRKQRHMGNESARELISAIRMDLTNLEELSIRISGNILLSAKRLRDLKEDVSLSQGLKKYEVKHDMLGILRLRKDDAAKDMSRYIMEKFGKMGVIEGVLISNKMMVLNKRVRISKLSDNEITFGSIIKA